MCLHDLREAREGRLDFSHLPTRGVAAVSNGSILLMRAETASADITMDVRAHRFRKCSHLARLLYRGSLAL